MPDKTGLIHIYYGDGKGKTTAAIGVITRALGYNAKIFIAQFLKTKDWISGEILFLSKFDNCRIIHSEYSHPFFYKKEDNIDFDIVKKDQKRLYSIVKNEIKKDYDIIILDEILNAVSSDFLSVDDVIFLIQNKNTCSELILTGRSYPEILYDKVDLITEFKEIKHPYRKGILARKMVDF